MRLQLRWSKNNNVFRAEEPFLSSNNIVLRTPLLIVCALQEMENIIVLKRLLLQSRNSPSTREILSGMYCMLIDPDINVC